MPKKQQQQGGSRKRKVSGTKKSKKTCPTNKHRNRTTKKCRCTKVCK